MKSEAIAQLKGLGFQRFGVVFMQSPLWCSRIVVINSGLLDRYIRRRIASTDEIRTRRSRCPVEPMGLDVWTKWFSQGGANRWRSCSTRVLVNATPALALGVECTGHGQHRDPVSHGACSAFAFR